MSRPLFSSVVGVALALGSLFSIAGCDELRDALPAKPAPAPNAGAAKPPVPAPVPADIVDDDYCFRLRSPGAEWDLLDEKAAQVYVPDAVAGALRRDGGVGIVIVEPAGDVALDDYVAALREQVAMRGFVPGEIESLNYQGRPARRYGFFGSVNGLEVRYENLVFLHQRHGFQLTIFGLPGLFTPELPADFIAAFSLIEGTVRLRDSGEAVWNFHDVGRRVVVGRFESPAAALAVEPAAGWRLQVGIELAMLDPRAEVGMAHAASGAFMMIVPHRIDEEHAAEFRRKSVETMLTNLGTNPDDAESLTYSLDGQPATFRRAIVTEGVPLEYRLGTHWRNGRGYEVILWWSRGYPDDPEAVVKSALEGVRFLAPDEVERLAQEMRGQPDPQHVVGPDWSLRGEVFRDFAAGWQWTKPHGYWRARVGNQLIGLEPGTRFAADEASRGVSFEVLAEPVESFDPVDYHQFVTEAFVRKGEAGSPIELAGRPARASDLDVPDGDATMRCHLVTAERNGWAFQITIFGQTEYVQPSAEVIEQVLGGFTFPGESLVASEETPNGMIDRRLGFKLELPGEWQPVDKTPATIRAAGRVVHLQGAGAKVIVMAIDTLQPGQDSEAILKRLEQTFLRDFSQSAQHTSEQRTTRWGGLEWRVRTYRTGAKTETVMTARKDETLYTLAIEQTPAWHGGPLLKLVKNGFQLLD